MEIVTQVYRVNPAAVRPLRRQVIDAILNSLSSANRRQAFAAANCSNTPCAIRMDLQINHRRNLRWRPGRRNS